MPPERGPSTNPATRLRQPPLRTDICNVVIFGETGVGKSSVVNLITGGRALSEISPDALGCTAEVTVHDQDIVTQNRILKLKLFDTPGLGEGSEGTVPDDESHRVLKKLLQELKGQDGIHLLMYCVRATRKTTALRRYYDSFHSKVKDVPIVLVITGLENQQPNMEAWWTANETFLFQQGMTFAGHACVTTLILRSDDAEWLRERYRMSYVTTCDLINQCRLPSGKGAHIDDYEMDNPRNVIICDSIVASPMNVCNIAGVTSGEWVKSMVAIRGQYYMFQRVTAPYTVAQRPKRSLSFEPHLLIFYADKTLPIDMQKMEVQKFCGVYAKFNVGLVVVVCGSDDEEDARSWWDKANAVKDPLPGHSIDFRLTYLPREVSEHSEDAQGVLKKLIWELSRPGEPRSSVVQGILNRVWKILRLGGGN